ncbi:YhdP family protein [Vogesella sp. LIG4]|uniref:YhdP family protein n=1 Tax=Vogesella sp. LIG4 TaxID=1192162 RepID=UPI0012FD217C|nr:YhdP family protein [Vogesella sp. LIG4]
MTPHSNPSPDSSAAREDHSLRIVHLTQRVLRVVAALLLLCLLLLGSAFLLFRFAFLPNVDRLRPDVERWASDSIGMPVKVGRISGQWLLWTPEITLNDLVLRPRPDSPPMLLREARLEPGWKSVLYLEPHMARITLRGLSLDLQRQPDGRLRLNGIPLDEGKGDGSAVDWLLRQDEVDVQLQRFTWHDQLLGLPPLSARDTRMQLNNGLLKHRLQVRARPESTLLSRLDLDASWRGSRMREWQQWRGDLALQADAPELGWLQRYWPNAPFSVGGAASSQLAMQFADGRVTQLGGKWQVEKVALSLSGQAVPLPHLAGQLDYQSIEPGRHALQASHLMVNTQYGKLLADAAIQAQWSDTRGGSARVSRLSLAPLLPLLSPHLPALATSPLARLDGDLQQTDLRWQGRLQAPQDFQFATGFDGLAFALRNGTRLAGGLSGRVSMAKSGGQLTLDGSALQLQVPGQLPQAVNLQKLAANLDWQRGGNGWQINVPGVNVATPDLHADIRGGLQLAADGSVRSDLQLSADSMPAARVPAYLPALIGKETVAWLRQALQGGEARQIRASLQGKLAAFPFPDGKDGRFEVSADIHDGKLQFEPGWPAISSIQGRFSMRNDDIGIDAEQAQTAGVALDHVNVQLPATSRGESKLLIKGHAQGELPQMLAYTRASPVDHWLDGFLSSIDSSGQAGLQLGLDIPLAHVADTRVDGAVALSGNHLQFRSLPLPALENVSGVLRFNEHGAYSPGIDYSAFGGRSHLAATLDSAGKMHFTSAGELELQQVTDRYVSLLSRYLGGKTPYQASFTVGRNLDELQLTSSLQGVASSAPAPLGKPAGDAWPLQLALRPTLHGWRLEWQQQARAAGVVTLRPDGALQGVGVGVGVPSPEPQDSISLHAKVPQLLLDPWLDAVTAVGGTGSGSGSGSNGSGMPPLQLRLETPQLQVDGKQLHDVDGKLDWNGGTAPLVLQLSARELQGQFGYQPAGNGVLRARMQRLALPLPQVEGAAGEETQQSLPTLDVQVDKFQFAGHELGTLRLLAHHQPKLWLLDQVAVQTPEAELQVKGAAPEGSSSASRNTELDFVLHASNAGALMDRIGLPGMLKGGAGDLSGKVQWLGQLTAFDLARITGTVKLDMGKGRFAQVEPGAGRLLGLLSLQSLTRRIRLDFTDVFSSGFAFDSLRGTANIDAGVFRSNDIQIQGPAAKVAMRGEADLANNRQQVMVRITPTVSESVAVITGATLLNPVAGAVAFAAQKLLQDPVSQILSYEYEITGSLTEPKVRKVGQQVEKPPAKSTSH